MKTLYFVLHIQVSRLYNILAICVGVIRRPKRKTFSIS